MPWFAGVTRQEIDWGPTIDPKKCVSCGLCLNCGKDVFDWIDGKSTVARRDDCVVGCMTSASSVTVVTVVAGATLGALVTRVALVTLGALIAGCAPPPAVAGLTAESAGQPAALPDPAARDEPHNPPTQPGREQLPRLAMRAVSLGTSPYHALLITLQRELDAGDSAALAIRMGAGARLSLYGAGTFEGWASFKG